ncbi:MAG TPA: hypothetical protein VF746_19885 [Longimicrobium sp.]|jgi:hypothetical protein
MADTTYQRDIERWVRDVWLTAKFAQSFDRRDVPLGDCGKYRFAAVSEDREIIALISTSESKMASGKRGVGKMLRIRAGVLFLIMARAHQRLVLLTERDMYEACLREKDRCRFPDNVEFHHVPLPPDLVEQLNRGRRRSSDEVRPR